MGEKLPWVIKTMLEGGLCAYVLVMMCTVLWLVGRCMSAEGCVHVWEDNKTEVSLLTSGKAKCQPPLCWTFLNLRGGQEKLVSGLTDGSVVKRMCSTILRTQFRSQNSFNKQSIPTKTCSPGDRELLVFSLADKA